jgi:ribose/xylose/arabinose/galactoside ABC-type transport system permease subunit
MSARAIFFSEYFVLLLTAACFLVLLPVTPGLASPNNAANLFSNMLPLLVVAVGQTFVLIAGGIDLSQTAIIALASTVGALVMTGSGALAAPVAVVTMLAIGAALGLLNGAASTLLRMPPFLVTLTTMMFFGGFAIWLTKSRNIYQLPSEFVAIGKVSVVIAALVAVAAHFALSRTLFGHWLYAVGQNPRVALVSGVPVTGTIIAAYVASGVCAALGSVLYTARLETGSPVLGQRIFLDVIAAAVIGGNSLFGGKGKVLWTVFGVLFIALLDNSLNLMGLSNFAVLTVKGAVILAAALLDSVRSRAVAAG